MEDKKDRRKLHTLRKTIEQSDFPQRKALIKLARESSPDKLRDIEHGLYLAMEKALFERRQESTFQNRHICCLELPEDYEKRLLEKGIQTVGNLCSFQEEELYDMGFAQEETSGIRALLGDVGLAFKLKPEKERPSVVGKDFVVY